MHGAIPPLLLAKVLLYIAWKCLVFVAPILTVMALWWLINRTDRIINYLFPHLEWERSLGWLNIKAERRAMTAVRWLGYGVQALLAMVLLGIVWAAEGFQQVDDWSNPPLTGDLGLRFAALGVCLGVWLLYLGCWLIPKLRAERDEIALKKFRAEMAEAEAEFERKRKFGSPSRVHSPLQKPRKNTPFETPVPDRGKNRRQPGG